MYTIWGEEKIEKAVHSPFGCEREETKVLVPGKGEGVSGTPSLLSGLKERREGLRCIVERSLSVKRKGLGVRVCFSALGIGKRRLSLCGEASAL